MTTLRHVKLNELGSASKSVERFIKDHITQLTPEIEQVICKLCDLKTVELSLVTDGQLTSEDLLKEYIAHAKDGGIIFGIDKQSIDSLLNMHLRINNETEEIETLTNTHIRLFRRLTTQLAKVLLGDTEIKPVNPDTARPSQQTMSIEVSHEGTKIAVVDLTLDEERLAHIRERFDTYPEVKADRVDQALQHVPVTLNCEVMRTSSILARIAELKEGDFLPMKKLSHVCVKVSGIEMFKGDLFNENNELGVKINEQLR